MFITEFIRNDVFSALAEAILFLFESSFFWLPIVLVIASLVLWIKHIRLMFVYKKDRVLLEIKMPQEVIKSPAAMEIFLGALYQKAAANYLETYLGGKIQPWFSLEFASIGGDVHMFIWTWKDFRKTIETQLYAQYPSLEVYEVKDYASMMPFDLEKFPLEANYFELATKDAYPIKTYIDFKLDEDREEENKIDPMSNILEYLGSAQKGEQVWIQILMKANRSEGLKEGRLRKKPDWKKGVEKEIEDVRTRFVPKEKDSPNRPPTKGEQNILEALERSLSKPAFDCAIRGIYIAEKDAFDKGTAGSLKGVFQQFGSNTLNALKPGFRAEVNYPWQDFQGTRVAGWKKKMLEAYKMRSYFQEPYKYFKQKPFILTTEELATLFHPASGIALQTPTFSRIPSRKAEPPSNLPT